MVVNPTSGGNLAAEFLKLNKQKPKTGELVPVTPCLMLKEVIMHIYDLKDEPSRKSAFSELLKAAKVGEVRLIVCGGDGTVTWAVSELRSIIFREEKDNLNNIIKNVLIGVVPFGTGNDFSRVLGWGGNKE